MFPTGTPHPKPRQNAEFQRTLAEEIQRSLEIMRRVRTSREAQQGKGDAISRPGNTYDLPELPILRVSVSVERD